MNKYLSIIISILVSPWSLIAQETPQRYDSIVKSLKLKEVVVQAKKIKQEGDTISYSAATYISKNDKSLEDLLKKMPGIEIKGDGQIVYNGKWINEFYIEGLNMLGGNYTVATKNINAQDIGTVQVLENHQDVKMLRGIERGNSPAINIKLKQRRLGIWSSTIYAAAGIQPEFTWDGSATLMNFSKNRQTIGVYKANNAGIDLRKEINAPKTFNNSFGTGIVAPTVPSLSDRYAYRNNSQSVSLNQLFKLSDDETLTFNVNYLYDKEKRESGDKTTYLSDSVSNYVFDESNVANFRQHFVGANSVYNNNGSKVYLKNTFSAKASFPDGKGIINKDILQDFSGHSLTFNDVLNFNYRKGKGGISNATFRVGYDDRKGNLWIPGSEMSQMVRQQNFTAKGSGSLVALSVPYVMFNLNAGFNAGWQRAHTDFERFANPNIYGDQQIWQLGAYLSPRLFVHKGQKWQWSLQVPVGFLYYNSDDNGWDYHKTMLSLTPYTYLSYKMSDKWTYELIVQCQESLPSALSLMADKRLMNYRTTMSNRDHVEARYNRTLKANLNAGYKSVFDMVFANLTLTYALIRNTGSSNYEINDGMVDYYRLPFSTDTRLWQFDQTFSKGFFKWNSKVSESLSMGISDGDYYVKEQPHTGKNLFLRAELSYNASFTRWLSFQTKNELGVNRTYTDGRAQDNTKVTFTDATSLSVWPFKDINVTPAVIFHHNNYTSSYRSNVFLDCSIEYTLKSVILSLQGINLLDNRVFRRYSDNGIITHSSEFRLRGRTLLLGIRLRL